MSIVIVQSLSDESITTQRSRAERASDRQVKTQRETDPVVCPALIAWNPRTSAAVLSQNNTCPSEDVFDCTLPARSRDRPAIALRKSTAFCERLRCRTHPV